MTANNSFIANQFSLLSKLLELHGENPFKVRAYSSAARLIDKLPQEISKLPPGKLASIKGIGDSVAKKIKEIFDLRRDQSAH
jgi:DNA polymerase (family 10)